MLVFTGWTWEQYEELLEALDRGSHGVHVSYDDGRLRRRPTRGQSS